MVKCEFVLDAVKLVVPATLADPRLSDAGHAWLDMALELFAEEVFSELELRWYRPSAGTAPVLMLSLDSSKNFRTKQLQGFPDAPPRQFKRRERFDAAVTKLFTRTTPEDLWAALANQYLSRINAYYILNAWSKSLGAEAVSYPRFSGSHHFLFHLAQEQKLLSHPWL